jgi:hypothetical protein
LSLPFVLLGVRACHLLVICTQYRKREASGHFRNKKREYLKDKINELAMNSKNKDIRDLYKGINTFQRG